MTTNNIVRQALLVALVCAFLGAGIPPLFQTTVHAAAATSDLTAVSVFAQVPDTGYVRFVRSSPDRTLWFIGTQNGTLLRSADGGRRWTRVRQGVPGGAGLHPLDLEISESDPRVVWTAGLDGVFRSTDGGITWTEADTRSDAPGRALGSVLALDPRHPLAAYLAGYRNGGFYLTSDGGRSWQETIPYPVSGIALDPASGADIFVISRTAGVQWSTDHGHTWSTGVQLGRYAGIGQATANAGRLLMVDGPQGGLFAALDGGGLMRSPDRGRTWQNLSAGLPQSSSGAGLAVPFDLTSVHGTLYTLLQVNGGNGLYSLDLNAAPAVPAAALVAATTPSSTASPTATGGIEAFPTATPPAVFPPTATVTTPAPTTTNGPPAATATMPVTATVLPTATATPPPIPTATVSPPATSTGVSSPTPIVPAAPLWRTIAYGVDAVGRPGVSATLPVIATQGASVPGYAATVRLLGQTTLYRVPYELPPPLVRTAGSGFAMGTTPLPYLYGVNYEGPMDRPWQMWQNGKFDPTLIAEDLDAAAAAGYRALRVFVQDPLPAQVLSGEFGHLDTLVTLASERDLRLLITFNDSRVYNLAQVIQVDRAIAQHLAGNPAILGYDLQNEPTYVDIVGDAYPPGVSVPLQGMALIQRYGQQISLKAVQAQRKAGEWQAPPFDHMTDRQVYIYLNNNDILGNAIAADPSYPETPPPAAWAPFFAATNQTLATYLQVQMDAIRSVDPTHLITVGYNRLFWATMPANAALSFRSIHLYPAALDWSSIHDALRTFESLQGLASSPLVLEEYGFSTADQSGAAASVQETAMSLYLRVLGGSGDFKWVLNDDLVGYNAYQNGLGLFARGDVPKPGFYVNRELAAYFGAPHQPGGVAMNAGTASGVGYLYAAPDALGVSGATYSDPRLRYQAAGNDPAAQLWLDWATPGRLRIVSTSAGDIWLNLGVLAGAVAGPLQLSPAQVFDHVGLTVHIHLQAGTWYSLRFTHGTSAVHLPASLPRPPATNGWYILSTGHNITGPLLTRWLALGGLSVAGAPLDDAQITGAGTTQYFTNLALINHGGSVSVLPLGLQAVGGKPLPAAAPLPNKVKHLYFQTTGHNLHGAFLQFWQSTGGAAVWGPPVSEEQASGALTVQYMANAEFSWDGAGVSLVPLGAHAWSRSGG